MNDVTQISVHLKNIFIVYSNVQSTNQENSIRLHCIRIKIKEALGEKMCPTHQFT